ncbi:PE family protein, partial [Mycobacterium tuberculosis]
PLAFPAPKAWPARPASAGRRRACRSRGAGLKPRARDCTPTRRLGRTTARARAQRAESSSSSFGLGHAMETLEAGRRYLC